MFSLEVRSSLFVKQMMKFRLNSSIYSQREKHWKDKNVRMNTLNTKEKERESFGHSNRISYDYPSSYMHTVLLFITPRLLMQIRISIYWFTSTAVEQELQLRNTIIFHLFLSSVRLNVQLLFMHLFASTLVFRCIHHNYNRV